MSDTHPLAPLVALGATDVYAQEWPDYVSWLHLTEANVPDLLRIVLETSWENRDWDHEPDAWAPIHAWRAIGQLRSQAAIQPLIELLDRYPDNELIWNEIPYVYALLGVLAIPPLTKYVAEHPQKVGSSYTAITALSQLGQYYPEARPLMTAFLRDRIIKAQENHPAINGYLVRALMDMRDEESVPAVREAFEESLVDESITGEWNDVLVAFGLADAQDADLLSSDGPSPRRSAPSTAHTHSGVPTQRESKKEKNKRKQAKKAQKANRKKR
jgi:hypothetical protein